MKYDVIVAGGGCAGVFAAISAARAGASTLLVEKNGILGGTLTAGRVNFPGLFFAWGKQVISGPCWEAIERCAALNGAVIPEISFKPQHHWLEQVNIDIFTYVHVLDVMCAEARVNVLLHTMVADVRENADGVKLTLATKAGLIEAEGRVLIDATGDADCIRMAGYETVSGDVLQPATLINDIDGYSIDRVDKAEFDQKLAAALADGILTQEDTQGNPLFDQLKAHRISMHIPCTSPETPEGRTYIEQSARNTLFRIVSFLRTVKGLENTYVSAFAGECGIRESVRIKGEKTVTSEDYINGTAYSDGICFSFYPIDLHIPTGIKQIFLKENTVPQIPAGALIPKNARCILAAGRCISSDRDANSALRVQATAMATGQAAGVIGYLSAKKGVSVKAADIIEAKNILKELGAIVP